MNGSASRCKHALKMLNSYKCTNWPNWPVHRKYFFWSVFSFECAAGFSLRSFCSTSTEIEVTSIEDGRLSQMSPQSKSAVRSTASIFAHLHSVTRWHLTVELQTSVMRNYTHRFQHRFALSASSASSKFVVLLLFPMEYQCNYSASLPDCVDFPCLKSPFRKSLKLSTAILTQNSVKLPSAQKGSEVTLQLLSGLLKTTGSFIANN